MWTLSGFADEIDPDPVTQCRVLTDLGIRRPRAAQRLGRQRARPHRRAGRAARGGAGGTTASASPRSGRRSARSTSRTTSTRIWPAWTGPCTCEALRGAVRAVFSFFLRPDQPPEEHRDEVLRRMRALAELAEAAGRDPVAREREGDLRRRAGPGASTWSSRSARRAASWPGTPRTTCRSASRPFTDGYAPCAPTWLHPGQGRPARRPARSCRRARATVRWPRPSARCGPTATTGSSRMEPHLAADRQLRRVLRPRGLRSGPRRHSPTSSTTEGDRRTHEHCLRTRHRRRRHHRHRPRPCPHRPARRHRAGSPSPTCDADPGREARSASTACRTTPTTWRRCSPVPMSTPSRSAPPAGCTPSWRWPRSRPEARRRREAHRRLARGRRPHHRGRAAHRQHGRRHLAAPLRPLHGEGPGRPRGRAPRPGHLGDRLPRLVAGAELLRLRRLARHLGPRRRGRHDEPDGPHDRPADHGRRHARRGLRLHGLPRPRADRGGGHGRRARCGSPRGALGIIHATTAAYPGLDARLRSTAPRGRPSSPTTSWSTCTRTSGSGGDRDVGQDLWEPGHPADRLGPDDAGLGKAHRAQLADFAAAVRDGRPPRVGTRDARTTLAVILAMYESARTGRPVALDGGQA